MLSYFWSRELQRYHKQAGDYISPGHYVADTELQILARFPSNLVANFMLCSSVACLKRMGNFKWIEIGISPLVLSLTFQLKVCMDKYRVFVYMLMRDASLKQRIPCIIRISIFGAFSAGKKCALYTGKYGIYASLCVSLVLSSH